MQLKQLQVRLIIAGVTVNYADALLQRDTPWAAEQLCSHCSPNNMSYSSHAQACGVMYAPHMQTGCTAAVAGLVLNKGSSTVPVSDKTVMPVACPCSACDTHFVMLLVAQICRQ